MGLIFLESCVGNPLFSAQMYFILYKVDWYVRPDCQLNTASRMVNPNHGTIREFLQHLVEQHGD